MGRKQRYRVKLTEQQRNKLLSTLRDCKTSDLIKRRARVLLVENRGCALVASSQNERQFNYRTRQMFCRDGMERVLRKPKTWSDNLLRVNRAGQIFILKMVKENHTASLRAIAEAYSDAGYGLISHEWVRTVLKRSGYRREWRRHA